MYSLKELRKEKKLTQSEVATLVGISLRSYKSYENDDDKRGTFKYEYLINKLMEINRIDEEHGILELDDITRKCLPIFEKYNVQFSYLFGSYAKGNATPSSDVDLLVDVSISGLKFYALVEEIRSVLHKKVDVLDLNQLKDNFDLTAEILRDGIKIYG